jgi:hypothetical protein
MRSFSLVDIYGPNAAASSTPRAPQTTVAASGKVSGRPDAPAISWLGLIIALVVIRLLWEYAPRGG